MLSYDLWAEFRKLQNFGKNFMAKFRRYEFRKTKNHVSLMSAINATKSLNSFNSFLSLQVFHNTSLDPPVGRWFEFSALAKGSLNLQSQPQKIRVFQTTPHSRAEPAEAAEAVQVSLEILL